MKVTSCVTGSLPSLLSFLCYLRLDPLLPFPQLVILLTYIRGECKLQLFENRVHREIFWHMNDEVSVNSMKNYVFHTHHLRIVE